MKFLSRTFMTAVLFLVLPLISVSINAREQDHRGIRDDRTKQYTRSNDDHRGVPTNSNANLKSNLNRTGNLNRANVNVLGGANQGDSNVYVVPDQNENTALYNSMQQQPQ